jgi:hypothetical protein
MKNNIFEHVHRFSSDENYQNSTFLYLAIRYFSYFYSGLEIHHLDKSGYRIPND